MRASLATLFAAALWAPTARAADCASPYPVDALLADLVAVEGFLRSGDDASAGKSASSLEAGLGCMNEVLPRMIAGRAFRAVGGGLLAGGNADRGTAWLRTAAEIEQSFEYGLEDLPSDHPVRDAYNAARNTSSGDELALDSTFASGKAYLDGSGIDAPAARGERPHLFQLDDGGVRSWVIEGNAFPESVLAGPAVAEADPEEGGKPPKEKKEKAPKEKTVKVDTPKLNPDGTVQIKRQRPWEKTPLMIGGASLGAISAGIYYASSAKRKDFEEASSLAAIEELQPQINRLVIVSAAVFAVGTGTFTWGVILDGGAPVPAVRIRF